MKPIEITAHASVQKSSEEICSILLDTSRWTEFTGYSFIPGIQSANFEIKNPGIKGSRIRVQNKDGSSHIEEITEWDVKNKVSFRFQEFNSPLKKFASHFIETWNFSSSGSGTEIKRTMTLYPKSFAGRLILLPVSRLLKKAIGENLKQLSRE